MNKTINHGIIGCGRIASNHVSACLNNNFNVLICCDTDLTKAKSFAKEHDIPNVTSNYLDLINFSELDSISICTDHFSHTNIASAFINRKHLIIEKPLSSNIIDAEKLVSNATNSSKIISVISQHRFDNVVLLTKKLIDLNAFGKITLVNIQLKCQKNVTYYSHSYWRGKEKFEGGSSVINQSFHLLDILTYFWGVPVDVKSYLSNYKFKKIIDTEDTCTAILKYDEFLCCFSTTNTAITEWSTSFEIIGTDGEISFTLDFPEKLLNLSIENSTKKIFEKQINQIHRNFKKNKHSNIGYFGLSHINQFRNFKNAILGKEDINVTLSDAIKTQKLINLIYSNSKTPQ